MRALLRFLVVLGAGALAAPVFAAPPAKLKLTPIASITMPLGLADPGDGSGRLFIVERGVGVRIIKNGVLLATPYLALDVPSNGEYGVLGIALDPDFAHNGRFYLAHTAADTEPKLGTKPDNVLTRYVASNPAADVFVGARQDVLRIPDASVIHNGGDIHFGPDGYLYWAVGDDSGGWWGAPQNLWKHVEGGKTYYLLGKILRLDVRGTSTATGETCGGAAGTTLQYRIPADNPFVGSSQTCDEIFHYGLRNPWRFSFDRATGEMYIGDVGQDTWEEINRVPAGVKGLNFGWSCYEGHAGSGGCDTPKAPTPPVFDYEHGAGYAITGGFVYRGPRAALRGYYFYGDSSANALWYAEPAQNRWHEGDPGITGVPMDTGVAPGGTIMSFGEDRAGNLYVLTGGAVLRIDTDATEPDEIFKNGFD